MSVYKGIQIKPTITQQQPSQKTTTTTPVASLSNIQLKSEPTEPSVTHIKTDQMMTILANRSDIIDSFVMKENQKQTNSDAFDTEYEHDGEQQWVIIFIFKK